MMDPDALSLKTSSHKPKQTRAPRHKAGERFLLGPIPMNWLDKASRSSGRGSAFQVAIAIWHISGLKKQARRVKLVSSVLRNMGINRHACYRGLRVLEDAQLIHVERHAGRLPIVTILDCSEPAD